MEDLQRPADEPRQPAIPRAERNAREVDRICRSIQKGPGTSVTGFDEVSLSMLRTLCVLVPGTESLREYVRELFETLCHTGELGKLPKGLDINIENGAFGLFNREHAREFERKQILDTQPAEMKKALEVGDRKKAKELRARINRWKERFEKVYGEKVEREVNLNALSPQMSGSPEKEGTYGV